MKPLPIGLALLACVAVGAGAVIGLVSVREGGLAWLTGREPSPQPVAPPPALSAQQQEPIVIGKRLVTQQAGQGTILNGCVTVQYGQSQSDICWPVGAVGGGRGLSLGPIACYDAATVGRPLPAQAWNDREGKWYSCR